VQGITTPGTGSGGIPPVGGLLLIFGPAAAVLGIAVRGYLGQHNQ
jgi:hypothetical protein